MAGIGGIGGIGDGGLSGMAGMPGSIGGQLSGLAELGVGGGDGGHGAAGGGSGLAPNQSATDAQGDSFGTTMRDMLIVHPSESKAEANDLMARFAAGENIDPHELAIASAKAGVEIQMATRTISSAVSAVRTLFQMQV